MVFGMLLLRIFIALQQLSVIVDAGPRATTDHSSELEATDLSDAHCMLSQHRTGLTVDLEGFFALHYNHLFRLQEQHRQNSASVSHSSFLQSVWSIPPERRWRHRGWVRRLPQRRTRRWHRRRHHYIHAVSGRILITPIVQRFLYLYENAASFCGCSSRHRTLKTRSLSTTCRGWCQPQRLEHRDPHLHAVCEQHSYAGMEHLLHVSQAGLPRSQVRAYSCTFTLSVVLAANRLNFLRNFAVQAGTLFYASCMEVRVAPVAKGAGLYHDGEFLIYEGTGTHGALRIIVNRSSVKAFTIIWMAGVMTFCLCLCLGTLHQLTVLQRRHVVTCPGALDHRVKENGKVCARALNRVFWCLLFFGMMPGCGSTRVTTQDMQRGISQPRSLDGDRARHPHWTGPTWIRKRAYNRAVRRAQASSTGTTTYRGQTCTLQDLQARRIGGSGLRTRSSWKHAGDGGGLIFMTWNAGGLTSGTLEEFMRWINTRPRPQQPNVICIQETHWTFDAEWVSGNWHHVHSGVSGRNDRYAGLLTLIRVPGLKQDDIRFHRVMQGRMDHIRFEASTGVYDVINVYQKAVSFTNSAESYTQRANVIKNLSRVISSMPQRNLLVMMGDMNLQLYSDSPHVGPRTTFTKGGEQISRDGELFHDMLRRHHLTVVNTWSCHQPHTYQHLQHRTQIDYIIVRCSQARGPAKQASPDRTGELTRWKDTRHRPVWARILHPKRPQNNRDRGEPGWSIDVGTVKNLPDSDGRLVTLRTQCAQALEAITQETYHQVPLLLGRIAQRVFPCEQTQRVAKWQEPSMTRIIDRMWWIYRCAKGRVDNNGRPFSLLQRWFLYARFKRIRAQTRAFSLVINFYPNVSAICVSAHSLSFLHFHVSQNFHDFRSMLYDLCFFRCDVKNTVMSECCDFLGVSESKNVSFSVGSFGLKRLGRSYRGLQRRTF